MPNSPVILRLTSTSPQFIFFSLAFTIYNILLSAGIFDTSAPDINLNVYNQLQFLFSESNKEVVSRVSLSLTQINILSWCVAEIYRALSGKDSEIFKSKCMQKLPALTETWDKEFLQNAKEIFTKYKDQFRELPEFNKVINLVS